MKVRYTIPSLADLDSVLSSIRQQSPGGARRVRLRVWTVIDVLSRHPHIGTRTNDPTIRRMTTLPYPYLIFDETRNAEIIIHAVRHAALDPSGMPGAAC